MVTTYSLTPGLRYDSHGWDSYVYLDTFPMLVRAELGSPDTVTAPGTTTATTLSAAIQPGYGTSTNPVTVAATFNKGDYISIGYPGTDTTHYNGDLETHQITNVTGTGPYSLTLATTINNPHASGEPVQGLYKHKFSLLNLGGLGNQPPTYTIMDFDGEEWRQLTAGQLDELTIKGNATELVDYTCTWFANPSVTPTAPSTTPFTSTRPVPSYTTAFLMNGTQAFDVEDFEIDLKRGTKPIPAFTGTEEYFEYFAGPLEATGNKLTVIETSGAPELTAFQNGLNQPFDFYLYDLWTGNAMRIHSTNVMYVTGELTRSKEYVEATLTYDFLPSSADTTTVSGGVSPLFIEVANAQSTAY